MFVLIITYSSKLNQLFWDSSFPRRDFLISVYESLNWPPPQSEWMISVEFHLILICRIYIKTLSVGLNLNQFNITDVLFGLLQNSEILQLFGHH